MNDASNQMLRDLPARVSVISSLSPLKRPARLPAHHGLAANSSDGGSPVALQGLHLGLVVVSLIAFISQCVHPRSVRISGLTIDRLSALLTLLVAYIGLITFRFSIRYLNGDRQQNRFLGWLSFTVLAAYVLMLSTNLLLLAVMWSLTSLGLHKLLTYYPERAEGIRAARKKFVISRLGDVALASAIAVAWWKWGTFDLHQVLEITRQSPVTGTSTGVALLFVLAALTKSAQFPFHSWLPETMEAPTPVSALMHAGIINAGGALLLRVSPLIVRVPEALLVLVVVGTVTAALGSISMWAQVKVKRTLAWSTVSQMGFMMVQCGLGAFAVALLHVVAHGCYKAWSFLRSGELPAWSSLAVGRSPRRTLQTAAIGIIAAIPAMMLASSITGFEPFHAPGELALTAVLAMSIGQMWVALCDRESDSQIATISQSMLAVVATVCVAPSAFALYQGAVRFLAPVSGDFHSPTGPVAWIGGSIPVTALILLTVTHALLPTLSSTSSGSAFRVHALHGFYFGAIADRLVAFIWKSFASQRN